MLKFAAKSGVAFLLLLIVLTIWRTHIHWFLYERNPEPNSVINVNRQDWKIDVRSETPFTIGGNSCQPFSLVYEGKIIASSIPVDPADIEIGWECKYKYSIEPFTPEFTTGMIEQFPNNAVINLRFEAATKESDNLIKVVMVPSGDVKFETYTPSICGYAILWLFLLLIGEYVIDKVFMELSDGQDISNSNNR